mmetsp:Transcript_2088/g.5114  ORF Transcript_2088/g.5114 Transcript_2088/m.5114 type:complete len:241 (+) Transcript_2088:394-1116(+)
MAANCSAVCCLVNLSMAACSAADHVVVFFFFVLLLGSFWLRSARGTALPTVSKTKSWSFVLSTERCCATSSACRSCTSSSCAFCRCLARNLAPCNFLPMVVKVCCCYMLWLWLWLWLFLTVRMVVQLRQRRRHGLTQRGKVFGTGPVDIGPLLQFRLERPRFGAVALVPTLKFQQVSVQGRGQGRKGLRRLLGVEFAVQTGNGLWWVRRWFGRWIGIDAVVVVTVVVVTVVDVDIVGMLG